MITIEETPEQTTALAVTTPNEYKAQIAQTLAAENITPESIQKLLDKYAGLAALDANDTAAYELMKAAKNDIVKHRTTVEKVCEDGRDWANKAAKLWLGAQKELVALIAPLEATVKGHLKAVDDHHENLRRVEEERIAKDKADAELKERNRVVALVNKLGTYGTVVSYEAAQAMTEDQFAELEADAMTRFETKRIEDEKTAAKLKRLEELEAQEEARQLAEVKIGEATPTPPTLVEGNTLTTADSFDILSDHLVPTPEQLRAATPAQPNALTTTQKMLSVLWSLQALNIDASAAKLKVSVFALQVRAAEVVSEWRGEQP